MKIQGAENYCVTLFNNYRCVPDLLDLPSSLFYNSSLNACAKVSCIRPYSLAFICSSLSEDFVSLCENETEAKIIMKEVDTLIHKSNVKASAICMMSSSQRQVCIILTFILLLLWILFAIGESY